MTVPAHSPAQPRPVSLWKTLAALAFLAALLAVTVLRAPRAVEREWRFMGDTMGTLFRVRLFHDGMTAEDERALQAAIRDSLAEVNRQMSTYDPDSEISRFNRAHATEPVPVSAAFAQVLRCALEVAEKSGGLFDPTVGPLVELWGFGAAGRRSEPPGDAEIERTRERVGYRLMRVTEDHRVVKGHPGAALDLGAVAKGYGADAVAGELTGRGFRNFFVEVGGEIHVSGHKADGQPWRIGVDWPRYDAPEGERLAAVLDISDRSVATSGEYRNYFKTEDGRVYGHILDPRSGYPVERPLASVTVLADTCMLADALSTALFLMGPDEGIAWLEEHYPEADALFFHRGGDGTPRHSFTRHFQERVHWEPVGLSEP